MVAAGGQYRTRGMSLNHRCDPEKDRPHDPRNDVHWSNQAKLTLPPPFNGGSPSPNLVKSMAGGRICDGADILHNFLEIFLVFENM